MSRTEPGTISGGPPTARAANSAVVTTEPVAANSAVITTIRRAAVWALLLAKLTAGWGLGWDIRWHVLIGRDSFWIPPHVLTYASVAAAVLIAFGVLAFETWLARGGRVPADTVRVAGLVGTPGFHLVWLGMALIVLAAPIDDLWHRLFGIDVTLWSPPHLLGLAGAQVSTLALLIVPLEVWPAGSRARLVALFIAGTFLFGTFAIVADPAGRIAFLYGGVRFFTWPVLMALFTAFSLALTTRLVGWRSAPVIVLAISLLVQLSTWAVADVGFALAKPTSVIAEVLAADDGTSPIAVAHEMARRNRGTPGRSLTARLVPLVPAVALALVDVRRRWALASLGMGAALFAVASYTMLRAPAFVHVVPDVATFVAGLILTLVAAVAGAWLAVGLAARVVSPDPLHVGGRL
jgi:hypothetical protein